MSDETQKMIEERGLNAPRVKPADVEAAIKSEHYFTAANGVMDAYEGAQAAGYEEMGPLNLLTFCVLVLGNGFTVTGESACASPENFDAEIGRKMARQNAVNKVWPLLGFRLRDRIAAGQRIGFDPATAHDPWAAETEPLKGM